MSGGRRQQTYPSAAVKIAGSINPQENGCWNWIAHLNNKGRPMIRWDGKMQLVHRVAFAEINGPIPAGLKVCHKCDNILCVRPAHLFLGTQKENIQDASRKGRIRRGERHNFAKLTAEKVLEIRRLAADGKSNLTIAEITGAKAPNVSAILRGKSWRHLCD